jgi:hypothetical protein
VPDKGRLLGIILNTREPYAADVRRQPPGDMSDDGRADERESAVGVTRASHFCSPATR